MPCGTFQTDMSISSPWYLKVVIVVDCGIGGSGYVVACTHLELVA